MGKIAYSTFECFPGATRLKLEDHKKSCNLANKWANFIILYLVEGHLHTSISVFWWENVLYFIRINL